MASDRFAAAAESMPVPAIFRGKLLDVVGVDKHEDKPTTSVDVLAKKFVVMSLALSHVDKDALDMEFLPDRTWPAGVEAVMQDGGADKAVALAVLAEMAKDVQDGALAVSAEAVPEDSDRRARASWIHAEAVALGYRVGVLSDNHIQSSSFGDQCEKLYNIIPKGQAEDFLRESLPPNLLDELGTTVESLEAKLGLALADGATQTLAERFDRVREKFVVPKAYYKDLFMFALEECRRRCVDQGIECPDLPFMIWKDSEEITWEAFEGFKGDGQSEMQVNLARLLSLDKFMQLPAHEAYPGHHTMFRLVEERSVKRDGFVELAVVNTFSPYSFVAEGGAEWGAQALLWGSEEDRVRFAMSLVAKLRELVAKNEVAASGSCAQGICGLLDITDPDLHELLGLWVRAAAITDPLDRAVGAVHCDIARKLLDDSAFTLDMAKKRMFEAGFRRDDSWPNASFLQELGAYIVNYSFAKTVVDKWIKKMVASGEARNDWHAFEQWAARPLPPEAMLGA